MSKIDVPELAFLQNVDICPNISLRFYRFLQIAAVKVFNITKEKWVVFLFGHLWNTMAKFYVKKYCIIFAAWFVLIFTP